MIENFGIGIDIINVSRFQKQPYEKKSSFYRKLFSPSEIKYCLKFKDPYQRFAGKFALKEAVKKSIKEPITFLEIETYHKNSKPCIRLTDKYHKKYRLLCSISHDSGIALGIVISEKIN
ncbi:MAG: holo-ACP synthase [Crenarchaeota archaeon]|nr:MAG: holo-ACP synthase [Thermoproteota archaeon]RDJ33322.1 MAG: holo-ACP synthase [Thermoproteota archaeon]RDJ36175.1 MAG: holo-ACP synthase [Thermoproteota archaeon]RDJ38806.1 MAG: holo-ACP synthase [Thermoproteota archaeon]